MNRIPYLRLNLTNIKNLSALSFLIALAFNAAALADSTSPYSVQVARIKSLEAQNRLSESFHTSLSLIDQIYRDIKVGQVVKHIDTSMTHIIDEIVTERHNNHTSTKTESEGLIGFFQVTENWGMPIFEELFHSESHEKKWDVTKLITRNAEEVARFSGRSQGDFEALKSYLVTYLNTHIEDIVLMKELTAKAYNLIWKIKSQKGPRIQALPDLASLSKIRDMAMDIHFIGRQTVVFCIQTNYTKRTKSTEDSQSNSSLLSMPYFGEIFNDSSESNYVSEWEQLPHSITTCDNPIQNETQISTNDDSRLALRLSLLDQIVIRWMRIAAAAVIVNIPNPAVASPHFGNPYFVLDKNQPLPFE